MSKSQSHPSGPDGDDDGTNTMDLPPTYAAATTTSPHTIPFLPPSPTVTSIFTSPLTSHLQTLPVRMREMQQAHYSDQASRDLEYITLLIPHVEAFLSDLVSMPRTPPVAELTLVPACAVPRGWAMTGAAERRREGEVVRVVRVEGYGKVVEAMSKGEKGDPAGIFTLEMMKKMKMETATRARSPRAKPASTSGAGSTTPRPAAMLARARAPRGWRGRGGISETSRWRVGWRRIYGRSRIWRGSACRRRWWRIRIIRRRRRSHHRGWRRRWWWWWVAVGEVKVAETEGAAAAAAAAAGAYDAWVWAGGVGEEVD
ncbi:hypothetical protein B0T17DRAFT_123670 [Bombardia bombarda]|uniref:Uncharacterized protein n=1 Tax=Bombardia bombarda TaxID=252184 RepID=A0AA39WAC7_9PEZI|nr:hypothetical protein B0T17DRAFT_123670 [Bombardia bombarda]